MIKNNKILIIYINKKAPKNESSNKILNTNNKILKTNKKILKTNKKSISNNSINNMSNIILLNKIKPISNKIIISKNDNLEKINTSNKPNNLNTAYNKKLFFIKLEYNIKNYYPQIKKMKGYVINLIERKDRLERFNLNITNYLNFVIIEPIEAINGNNLNYTDPVFLNRMDKEHYKLLGKIVKGEVGCCLSHLKCYEKIINNDDNYAIIFEDDCNFKNDIVKNLANNFFMNLKLPKKFGIIYLNKFNQNIVIKTNDKYLNKVTFGNQTSESYIISKEFAKILYNENINYLGPIDLHFEKIMLKYKNYPFFILVNNLFIQFNRNDSNIR